MGQLLSETGFNFRILLNTVHQTTTSNQLELASEMMSIYHLWSVRTNWHNDRPSPGSTRFRSTWRLRHSPALLYLSWDSSANGEVFWTFAEYLQWVPRCLQNSWRRLAPGRNDQSLRDFWSQHCAKIFQCSLGSHPVSMCHNQGCSQYSNEH